MGGVGSGRKPDIYRQFTKKEGPIIPAGEEIVLPNLSGDHSAGHTGTPSNDTDLVNKKYVDDNFLLNTGDTATGDYHFDAMSLSGSNVGIGTTGPGAVLDIETNGKNADLYLDASANTGYYTVMKMLTDRPSDGQTVGELMFYNNGAAPVAEILVSRGSTDIKGDISFYTSNSEQMRIDEDGNVGIGTASPASKLEVVGDVNVSGPTGAGSSVDLIVGRPDNTQADLILYGDNGVGGPLITLDNAYSEGGNINNWQIGPSGTGTDNILTIGPNTDTDAFTFHSNGNVGIGTTSPATPLHISGGAVTISNASAPSTPANAGAIFVSGGQVWCMGGSGTQTLLGAA